MQLLKSKVPHEVEVYMEECEEQGFLPGTDQIGEKFDGTYGEEQVNEWAELLGLSDLPQPLPEMDLEMVPDTPYQNMSPQERDMKLAGHKYTDFI